MRGVHRPLLRLLAFAFLSATTFVGLRADDAPNASPPLADGEAGVLVLQDGGVLRGQITRAADWYVITRGAGQMQIAQSRVLVACRSLDDAYEFRRKQIDERATDHLRLAEWCMRYDLRAQAARELADARRIDPDQLRIDVLERRLEKTGSRPVVKESVYLKSSKAAAKPSAAEATPAAVNLATEYPEGVVELFTRKVQPVLVNNCTTAGCHSTGSRLSFQLDRAILRGESNRRTTMRNLEATLALVDREHPDQSLLLTVPRRTHGGTAGPVLGPRKEQAFKHLVDWVALIAPPEPAPPATGNPAESDVAKTVAPSLQSSAKTESEPAEVLPQPQRQFALHAEDSAGDDSSMTLRSPHQLHVGAKLKSWQPRDAFDPEIFNRAQRARGQAQSNSAAPQSAADAAQTTDDKR